MDKSILTYANFHKYRHSLTCNSVKNEKIKIMLQCTPLVYMYVQISWKLCEEFDEQNMYKMYPCLYICGWTHVGTTGQRLNNMPPDY